MSASVPGFFVVFIEAIESYASNQSEQRGADVYPRNKQK